MSELGLRHQDSFGPIGSGVHDIPGGSSYKPNYTGPSGAVETFDHVIGSPASIGSTRFNDLKDLFFGEREAIKLAFANSNPSQTTANNVGGNNALAQAAPALVVVGRRQVRSNNSWMHNLPILAKGPFRCTALGHPQDAERAGLKASGDGRLRARLANGAKSVEVEVEVSAQMMPGVISVPHGWGHDLPGARLTLAAERPGVNLNALFDENARDPLSGNAVLSGVAVSLHAV